MQFPLPFKIKKKQEQNTIFLFICLFQRINAPTQAWHLSHLAPPPPPRCSAPLLCRDVTQRRREQSESLRETNSDKERKPSAVCSSVAPVSGNLALSASPKPPEPLSPTQSHTGGIGSGRLFDHSVANRWSGSGLINEIVDKTKLMM